MKPIKLKINTKTKKYSILIGSNLVSNISKIVKDFFSEKHWSISEINANRAINSDSKKRTGHKEIIIKNYKASSGI